MSASSSFLSYADTSYDSRFSLVDRIFGITGRISKIDAVDTAKHGENLNFRLNFICFHQLHAAPGVYKRSNVKNRGNRQEVDEVAGGNHCNRCRNGRPHMVAADLGAGHFFGYIACQNGFFRVFLDSPKYAHQHLQDVDMINFSGQRETKEKDCHPPGIDA